MYVHYMYFFILRIKVKFQITKFPMQTHPRNTPLSQSRFNPKGAVREDLGDVLKPKLDPKLDA